MSSKENDSKQQVRDIVREMLGGFLSPTISPEEISFSDQNDSVRHESLNATVDIFIRLIEKRGLQRKDKKKERQKLLTVLRQRVVRLRQKDVLEETLFLEEDLF